MTTTITGLRLRAIALVDRGANPGAHVTLFKSREAPMGEDSKALEARIAELEKQVQDRDAELQALKEPPPDPVEKAKQADPKLAERLAGIEKQAKADRERAEAAEARIKKMEDASIRAGWVRKAQDLACLGPADDVGGWLHKISDALTEDEFKAFREKLGILQNVVAKSALFAELGVSGTDEPTSATQQLEKLARELVTKSEGLTYEQALVRAYEENPELYAKAREE